MAIFRGAQNSVTQGLSMAASDMLLFRTNGPIEDIPWALGETLPIYFLPLPSQI